MRNQLTGNEKFMLGGEDLDLTISEFWSWAYSDLLNNTYRGVLAEFIVYKSLQIPLSSLKMPDKHAMRVDWEPYDIKSPSGRRIEVKSAAYLQAWENDYYSKILFSIAPRRAWSPEQGYSPECKRQSDLYVFCIYTALTREKSILDLDLWDFYVLATSTLNQKVLEQKSISLPSLLKLKPVKTDYSHLAQVIEELEL
ncbi:hypothetical protein [Enterocloster bolteae]|uniref:hypothetical protein n=1 Tax=Enterocloster bolteae TaxID=208479 RepID=UPI002A7F0B1B|nr:hypothetical protein [Enterocloster bolteae]